VSGRQGHRESQNKTDPVLETQKLKTRHTPHEIASLHQVTIERELHLVRLSQDTPAYLLVSSCEIDEGHSGMCSHLFLYPPNTHMYTHTHVMITRIHMSRSHTYTHHNHTHSKISQCRHITKILHLWPPIEDNLSIKDRMAWFYTAP